MSNSETVTLKLTAAVVLGGVVHKAGSLVEVDDAMAKNLLNRRKAELATEKGSKKKPDPDEAEFQRLALDQAAQEEKEAAAMARAMKDNELDEAAFADLSNNKRKALVKAAHEAIAKDLAQQ